MRGAVRPEMGGFVAANARALHVVFRQDGGRSASSSPWQTSRGLNALPNARPLNVAAGVARRRHGSDPERKSDMGKDKGARAKAREAPEGRDWSETLFLPKTDFPMRAGLPELEPRLLARWDAIGLYERLRGMEQGRPKFVLHDGPPYANGNIHIGHALNKILKDVVTRSQQMLGHDSNYVPGWDCHGLPIEWKIEEQYRAKGKEKPNFSDPDAINAFRD